MFKLIVIYILSVIICRELNIQIVERDHCWPLAPGVWLIPIVNIFISVFFVVVLCAYICPRFYKFFSISENKIIKWFRGDYRINK